MHACSKKRKETRTFELKSKGYRDGIKRKETTELLSVQCLQVDDVIPILSPAVYCGFDMCGSQRFTWWHHFLIGV